jgi:hypothetical protein
VICPLEGSLAILPAEQSSSKPGGTGQRKYLRNIALILVQFFKMPQKSYMGQTVLLSLPWKACFGFLSPLKIHCFSRVLTREPWSNDKQFNHYTPPKRQKIHE